MSTLTKKIINKKDAAIIERLFAAGDTVESIAQLLGYQPERIQKHIDSKKIALTTVDSLSQKHDDNLKKKHCSNQSAGRVDPMQIRFREGGGFEVLPRDSDNVDQEQATFESLAEATGVNEPLAGVYLLDSIANAAPFEFDVSNEAHINRLMTYLHQFDCDDAKEGLIASQALITNEWLRYCGMTAKNKDLGEKHKARLRSDMIKLMNLSIRQMETLNRLKDGGNKTITIKHQNIQMNGGQQVKVGG